MDGQFSLKKKIYFFLTPKVRYLKKIKIKKEIDIILFENYVAPCNIIIVF